MPQRLLVIGLDGAPFPLVKALAEQGRLPNLAALIRRGVFQPLASSLPNISNVAWTSFFTGTHPGIHRIFGFSDRSPGKWDLYFPNFTHLKTPGIFEWAERARKRVISVNMPATYPARPVPGILVSGFVAIKLEKAVHPPEVLPRLQKHGYRIDVDYALAKTDRSRFFDDLFQTHARRRAAMLDLIAAEPWDVFIAIMTGPDRMQHYCWDAYETRDAVFGARFVDYYSECDRLAGELVERAGPGAGVIVLSDHGFCAIEQEANLNVWMRQRGYLKLKKDPAPGVAVQLSDVDPASRAYILDPCRVYLTLEGREPGGRIRFGSPEYQTLCSEIRDGLLALEHSAAPGRPARRVIERVWTREEAYGPAAPPEAPDLVAIGARGFDPKGSLSRPNLYGRTEFTGMHTQDDAILISTVEADWARCAAIHDVLPTAGWGSGLST